MDNNFNPYQLNVQPGNPNQTLDAQTQPANNASPSPPLNYRPPAEQLKIRRRPVPSTSNSQPSPQLSLHTTIQPGPQSFTNIQPNQAQGQGSPPQYSPYPPPSNSSSASNVNVTRRFTTPQSPVKGSAFKIFKKAAAAVLSPLNAYTPAKPPVRGQGTLVVEQTSPPLITNTTLGSSPLPMSQANEANNGCVIINGVILDQSSVMTLQLTSMPVKPGRHWWLCTVSCLPWSDSANCIIRYDSRCGAWGYEGGPCVGIISPGLNLGQGPMQPNASGPSATEIYINGRQIHTLDVLRLRSLGVVSANPGTCRWWLNADGTYGLEESEGPMGHFNPRAMVSGQPGYFGWRNRGSSEGGGQGFGSEEPIQLEEDMMFREGGPWIEETGLFSMEK
jgi:hypothetical protein